MKKLIVFALVLAMAFAVPTAVLADSFVSSPSNQNTPTTEDSNITVTGYGERDTLPDDAREDMEAAYEDIKGAKDVTDLTDDLEDVIKDAGLTPKDTAVGSLFDVTGAKEGDDVELVVEDGEDFVALLYFDGEEWHVVEDAKVNGKKLTYTSMGDGTYALVVATDNVPDGPPTGEALPVGFIALAVLFGVSGVCFFVKSKANA